jgi:hypothetical protein
MWPVLKTLELQRRRYVAILSVLSLRVGWMVSGLYLSPISSLSPLLRLFAPPVVYMDTTEGCWCSDARSLTESSKRARGRPASLPSINRPSAAVETPISGLMIAFESRFDRDFDLNFPQS